MSEPVFNPDDQRDVKILELLLERDEYRELLTALKKAIFTAESLACAEVIDEARAWNQHMGSIDGIAMVAHLEKWCRLRWKQDGQ